MLGVRGCLGLRVRYSKAVAASERRVCSRALARQAHLLAESKLRAIGGGRCSESSSDPDDLCPGSLKGKTCNGC